MRVSLALLTAAATVVVLMATASATTAPIIGILTVPTANSECGTLAGADGAAAESSESCFATVYVKWLESAGARVAPIPYNTPAAELRKLVSSLNGVLFTGGGASLVPGSAYFAAANTLFSAVADANAAGVYTPLWGTCMGFQTLSLIVANDSSVLVSGFDSEDYSIPLDFTRAAAESRMFGSAPPAVMATLATQNVTANLHHSGVTPDTYASNDRLAGFFDVLSTNSGRKGKVFVSTIEGKSAPVYGTQWHPERPTYEWRPQLNLNHSPAAIAAMQYMADFFVAEARKSTASFPSPDDEAAALIYNYAPMATGSSYACYFFS